MQKIAETFGLQSARCLQLLANSCDICYNNHGSTAQYTQIVQYCFTLFLEAREIMAKTEAVYARIDTNLKHK